MGFLRMAGMGMPQNMMAQAQLPPVMGDGIGGGLPPGMGGPPPGMANPMSGMGSISNAELGAMQGAFGGNPQFMAQLQALMAQQGPGAATPMRVPPQMPPFNPTAEPQRGRSSGGILDRIKSRMV